MKRLLFLFFLASSFATSAWAQDSLIAPDVVENGTSVRMSALFLPVLSVGDTFVLSVNGKQVLEGSVTRGSMTGIDTNVIGSSSSTLLVIDVSRGSRTNQAERSLRVTLPGSEQPPDTTLIAANSVRIRSINQNIRMLFTRDTPFVGEMTLADSAFAVAIKSNGGLSKNSYFSISGSVSDQVALSFGQGSSALVRDDPKVFGRSARGG